jgi:hypothetical protein
VRQEPYGWVVKGKLGVLYRNRNCAGLGCYKETINSLLGAKNYMDTFKLIVDLLASCAAFVAIVAALTAWYRSARKPLVIDRLVIHKKTDKNTFILKLKNRKDYPVTIKRIDCHTRRHFTVQQKPGEPPEYQDLLNLADRILSDNSETHLAANAHTDVRIKTGPVTDSHSKLLFSFDTSHGFHQLWCSNILIVPIGVAETYTLDYERDFHSRIQARLFYAWAKFRNAIGWRIKQ